MEIDAKYIRHMRRILINACGNLNLDSALSFMTVLNHNTRTNSPFSEQNANFLGALKRLKYGPRAAKFLPAQRRIAASIQRRWVEKEHQRIRAAEWYAEQAARTTTA